MQTTTPIPTVMPAIGAYAPVRPEGPIDLYLDANEGPPGAVDLAAIALACGPAGARRYPTAAGLETDLAAWLGTVPERMLVTAGGDDAIDRLCRAVLGPGREIIVPTPTFEMIPRLAMLAGGSAVHMPWAGGGFPTSEVLDRLNPSTGLIAVVSPNNPTGAVATASDLSRLSTAAPDTIILADLAYTEFADVDLTPVALSLPNVVLVRTFSKAFGLAGLRVGYACGPERIIAVMRSVGSPLPVSGISIAAARSALQNAHTWLPRVVERVRREREELGQFLTDLGARVGPSQGNFVLAELEDAEGVWNRLAAQGIGVRRFPGRAGLERSLRITCPCDQQAMERLCIALRHAIAPNTPASTNP